MFFLSHAGSDAPSAHVLAQGLKAAGLDVWCAQEPSAMTPGLPFPEQLERKLRESTGLLLLVGRRGEIHPVMYALALIAIGLLFLEHVKL